MRLPTFALLTTVLFPVVTLAQFGQFFEQMFNGGSPHQQHQQQREQDVASDASWYKKTYEGGMSPPPPLLSPLPGLHLHLHLAPPTQCLSTDINITNKIATCSKYLCPGTLSCVDKPTHCPCAFPDVEEKYELDTDGIAICLSRSLGGVAGPQGGNVGWEGVRERLKSGGTSDTARKVELARKGLL